MELIVASRATGGAAAARAAAAAAAARAADIIERGDPAQRGGEEADEHGMAGGSGEAQVGQ